MRMLKPPLFILLFLLAALPVSACRTSQPTAVPTKVLDLSNTEASVQQFAYAPKEFLDSNVISAFDELTNLSILEQNYSTDSELVSAVESPSGKFSFVVASNYAASLMIEKGLLAPLNLDNIPNVANLNDRFRNLDYDPGNQYCIPFTWGIIGIGYVNGQSIAPTNWGDLFRVIPGSPAFGRMTILDHPREAIGAALIHLGYSLNTTNDAEVLEAKQLILVNADRFDSLNSLSYGEQLANFQILLAQGWSRDFLYMQEVNPEVNFAIPQEGGLLRIYSFCIPEANTIGNKEAAEAFINLTLDNEWVASSVFNFQMPATSKTADDLIALNTRNNPLIYPPEDVLNQTQYVYSLGNFELIYENIWKEIQDAIR